ncbi:hypothetical protein L2E82_09205 [Cichorium intybus]|uniref:Uncharacterized protein n=1 Tax=Cichorium intybus TaxID=13427 RepID=A0ACB9G779_CICIN|nr:hypothetical protein L2E82_09205 [Cichorium intybus]
MTTKLLIWGFPTAVGGARSGQTGSFSKAPNSIPGGCGQYGKSRRRNQGVILIKSSHHQSEGDKLIRRETTGVEKKTKTMEEKEKGKQ